MSPFYSPLLLLLLLLLFILPLILANSEEDDFDYVTKTSDIKYVKYIDKSDMMLQASQVMPMTRSAITCFLPDSARKPDLTIFEQPLDEEEESELEVMSVVDLADTRRVKTLYDCPMGFCSMKTLYRVIQPSSSLVKVETTVADYHSEDPNMVGLDIPSSCVPPTTGGSGAG